MSSALASSQALPAASSSASVLGSFMALLLVLALILALAWLVKRVMGKNSITAAAIQPVASLSVGTRERILIVQVGDEQLLIGVTAQQISLLHQLEKPLPTHHGAAGFANLLMALRKDA